MLEVAVHSWNASRLFPHVDLNQLGQTVGLLLLLASQSPCIICGGLFLYEYAPVTAQ
ncbi:hypothetical protein J31TS4_08090 [Paenibacillus sp. J31TS4]|nr:hypothetical protein J31TS4_08090 [Paenibacillus sp. J31TS4]